jgi:transposase-like protein
VTDNCPGCCAGPNEPILSRSDDEQATETYRCPSCGHTWTTRRSAAAYQDFGIQPELRDLA